MQETFQLMLFEDNPDDAMIAVRALHASGIPLVVQIARSGDEALDVLGIGDQTRKEQVVLPDLVISDLKMPKVSGAEILSRARNNARLADLPFVIFSSSDEPSDVEHCMALGASAYCIKPVDYTEFVNCLKDIATKWLRQSGNKADITCALAVDPAT